MSKNIQTTLPWFNILNIVEKGLSLADFRADKPNPLDEKGLLSQFLSQKESPYRPHPILSVAYAVQGKGVGIP